MTRKTPDHRTSRITTVLRSVFLPAIMGALLLSVANTAIGTGTEAIGPRLSINIPGVTLQGIVRATENVTGAATVEVIDIPWISNYIAGVYRYAVSIAGLIAGVMFVMGGFQYLTAGGDSSRVSQGRERITNAVIGLLMVFGAYVMLLTINPDLVSLTSLRVRGVAKKTFETISPAAMQTLTGAPPVPVGTGGGAAGTAGTSGGGSGMMGMAMEAARQKGIPELPCFVQGSMKHESGGKQNALGHDENAATTVFSVGARRSFINSGRMYSGSAFQPAGCSDKSCQNQGPLRNDDPFKPDQPPEYGLDWRYSHGFGSGQSTIFNASQPCPGQTAAGRGFRMGSKCYTIPQIMSAEGQVEAMVNHYEHCWRRGGGNVAAAYVCYAGTIAADNPIIVARVNDYNACRARGG